VQGWSGVSDHFPIDEAASKLLYLALRNIEKDWKMPPVTWTQAGQPMDCSRSEGHFWPMIGLLPV
jgi:transposase-like protein